MANTRNGNTYYVDTAGTLPNLNKTLRLKGIIITPSASPGSIVLKDADTLAPKGTWSAAASGLTTLFDLITCPIVFPNGIVVSAVTSCTALLILEEARA